jgi:hypothetical protein
MAAAAMSSGQPTRPTGIRWPLRASSAGTSSSGSSLRTARLVPTAPGQMALTVMPHGATSIDSARVKPMIAALDAEYAVERGAPIMPAIDDTLMIRPHRWRRMTGTANRDIR